MSVTATHPGGIADHIHPEPQGFIRRYVFSIDHKIIGIQYLITGFVFLILAGMLAEVIRVQLLNANGGFVSSDVYNEVYSVHGSSMVGS
jgi:cytochrome c oxidase subunit I